MTTSAPVMEYHHHVLPDDWVFRGAIASPEGYNGHVYLANVAQDPSGLLWVFARSGRFTVQEEEFNRKKVSDYPLIGAPYTFNPIRQ